MLISLLEIKNCSFLSLYRKIEFGKENIETEIAHISVKNLYGTQNIIKTNFKLSSYLLGISRLKLNLINFLCYTACPMNIYTKISQCTIFKKNSRIRECLDREGKSYFFELISTKTVSSIWGGSRIFSREADFQKTIENFDDLFFR